MYIEKLHAGSSKTLFSCLFLADGDENVYRSEFIRYHVIIIILDLQDDDSIIWFLS